MNESQIFMEKMDALVTSRDLTYKELERRLGLANGFFGKLRKRDTVPTLSKIDVIAEYFHVSRAFLLNIENTPGTKIPLFGKIVPESPHKASENIIGYEEITQAMHDLGEFFALLIKGDSMSPDLQDGDIAIVKEQTEVENGQLAIVLIGEEDGICREVRKTESSLMLISRNPNCEPMIFTHEDIKAKSIKIIGRVVEIRRKL